MHLHQKRYELLISGKHSGYRQKVVGCRIDNGETGYRSMKEILVLERERKKQHQKKSYERYIDKQQITKQKSKQQQQKVGE